MSEAIAYGGGADVSYKAELIPHLRAEFHRQISELCEAIRCGIRTLEWARAFKIRSIKESLC